jgi:beta-mannanase
MRFSTKLAAVAAVLVVCTSLLSCANNRGTLGSKIAPKNGSLYGAFEMPTPGAGGMAQYKAQILAKEQFNGRKYDILHYFYPWGAALPSWREHWNIENGRTPMVSWAGPVVSTIIDGSQNAHIDKTARGLRDLKKPVILRFFWEMDGTANVGRALGPEQYKQAWRLLRQRFQAAGATNVEFAWVPTADGFRRGEAQKWYPGDDAVDWIGADGYNWYPVSNSGAAKWRSFAEIFTPFYQWASQRPKPLIIGETGAQEDPAVPNRKAQWLKDSAVAVERTFPRIKAVVYFNGDDRRQYPWMVESSAPSKSAWRSVGQTAHMRAGS